MAARKKKAAIVEGQPGAETAPSAENAVQVAFKRVSALLKQRARLDTRKAEAGALEAQLIKLKAENSGLEKELKDAEKALRAEIPEVGAIFEASAPRSEVSDGTAVGRPQGRKPRGGTLSPEQVDKVLAGLAEPFGATDFSSKAGELFPGLVNVPIKRLAAGKIQQVPGTASRGTKYTRRQA